MSNLFSTLALAETLQGAGHDVTFAAPDNCHSAIAHAGFPVIPVQAPLLSVRAGYLPDPGLLRTAHLKQDRTAQAVARIEEDGFAQALKQTAPDMVLADCEHHSAVIRSIAAGHRTVLLSFMYFSPPGPLAPPLTTSAIPGRGLTGTPAAVSMRWRLLDTTKNLRLRRASFRRWGADMATAHRALADKNGVDLDNITTRKAFQTPWGYRLPTLALVDGALDFPAPAAEHLTFLGPQIWRNRPRPVAAPDPGRFFARGDGKKRIFAGFGSMRRPPVRFIQALNQVAQAHPGWDILVAGDADWLLPCTTPADNLQFAGWAPQLDALDAADCAIFHGGAGTFGECLATATPMLICPNALDGKGNAARAQYHGIGMSGGYRDGPAKIAQTLQHLMTSESTRSRLAQIQKRLASDQASGRVADVVGRLMRRNGATVRSPN